MIKKINLKNVRCFTNSIFNINSKNIILTGNNAIGKTTILESIYLASLTKSHRTNNLKEIIKDEQEFADIKIFDDKNEYRIILSEKGKMVLLNKNEIKKISEYIGKFPTILFSPYDLDIVTGSPTLRRQFLNQEISQINPKYLQQVNLYNKLLHERNSCLKELNENSDLTYLKVITNELIKAAKPIILARNSFIEEVNKVINVFQKKLNLNEKIEIIYKPSVQINDLEKLYQEKMLSDIFNNVTQYGPHRDEVIFLLDNKNIKEFGSQGQQRVAILSVKLSEINIFRKYKKVNPILLLDDVFSELDDIKKNNLIKYLKNDNQVVITTTDLKRINKKTLGQASVFKIKEGKIIRMEEFE